jgi:hypothetical protein
MITNCRSGKKIDALDVCLSCKSNPQESFRLGGINHFLYVFRGVGPRYLSELSYFQLVDNVIYPSPTKVQAIRRKKTVSQCYVNLPLPLAAAIDVEPGEIVQSKVDAPYKPLLIRQRPKKRNKA